MATNQSKAARTTPVRDERVELTTSRFGLRLKLHRRRTHMSQQELGQLVGVSAQTIRKWEKGFKTPQPRFIETLIDLLDYASRSDLTDDFGITVVDDTDQPTAEVIDIQDRYESADPLSRMPTTRDANASQARLCKRAEALEASALLMINSNAGTLTDRQSVIVEQLLLRASALQPLSAPHANAQDKP